MDYFKVRRERMVERQIAARGIDDHRVLAAMRRVPREAFVPPNLADSAYNDTALPIAEGQTISQPYVVALMAAAIATRPSDRILEIGTGSGYAAAVLSRIVARVYSVERHRALAEAARRRLAELGYDNVEVRVGDGTLGWPENAPYDGILVTAGAGEVPEPLREQLVTGGVMVIPVGPSPAGQRLVRLRRQAHGELSEEFLSRVAFVPLIGASGPGSGP